MIIQILVATILILIAFHMFYKKPTYKVYGTYGCGWTRKQLDHLGNRAKFYNCDNGECPSDIQAYPVTISPDGKRHEGYTTFSG